MAVKLLLPSHPAFRCDRLCVCLALESSCCQVPQLALATIEHLHSSTSASAAAAVLRPQGSRAGQSNDSIESCSRRRGMADQFDSGCVYLGRGDDGIFLIFRFQRGHCHTSS
jgi:hypothetical protein